MSTVEATTPLRRSMILWLALLVGLITPAVAFSMAASAQESPAPTPAATDAATEVATDAATEVATRDVEWRVVAEGVAVEDTEWVLDDGSSRVTIVDDESDPSGDAKVADQATEAGRFEISGLAVGEWTLEVAQLPDGVLAPADDVVIVVEEGDGIQELDDIVLDAVPSEDATEAVTDSPTEVATPSATPTPTDPIVEPSESPTATPTEAASPEPTPTATEKVAPAPPPTAAALADEGPSAQLLAVPDPGNDEAVINVVVGGDRTGTAAVGPLAGVVLQLYNGNGNGPTTAVTDPWATCTSDADGDCSFVVPNTGCNNGQTTCGPGQQQANYNRRFWVVQQSAPAGWFMNGDLEVGPLGNTNSDNYDFRTGTALTEGNTYTSTQDFMIGTGGDNNQASGGVWQDSRDNPTLPPSCGLDVALVNDLSGSVSGDLDDLKAASVGFVQALIGTPSRVAAFTFAQDAPRTGGNNANFPLTSVTTPADAQPVIDRINGYSAGGSTNWDRGLYQVETAGPDFDVVIMITDGDPTVYNQPAQGPGDRTRFREAENGIFSANALKASGSRVIAFGVGDGISGPGLNLRAISGPIAFDGGNGETADYYQTGSFDEAGEALRALALANCQGSVTIIKEVLPPGGTPADAVPSGGWEFTGQEETTGITLVDPTSRLTDPNTGAVNFPIDFDDGVTSGDVSFTETLQNGFEPFPVDGQNATCTNTLTGADVPVTNDGNLGFTITVEVTAPISCVFFNLAPLPQAEVVVDKQWVINGTTYDQGTQPDGFEAELTLTGPDGAPATPQAWGATRTGYEQGDITIIDEIVTIDSFLCTLTDQALVSTSGSPLNGNEATLDQPVNSFLYTNTVQCDSQLSLAKNVVNGSADPTEWILDAIAPDGALPGPSGVDGTPEVTEISVTPGVTYQLAESGGPLTYTQLDLRSDLQSNPLSTGSMICVELDEDGDIVPGYSDGLNGGVSVPLGFHVECTARNRTAELTLVKELDGPLDGTTVTEADFDLTATPVGPDVPAGLGPQTVAGAPDPGVTIEVRPDQPYQVSESDVPGWTQTDLTCETLTGPVQGDEITLAALGSGTCTFTNTRNSAELTLVKNWVNGAAPDVTTITADGEVNSASDVSTAPTDGTSVTIEVFSGESVELSEMFDPGNDGDYTPDLVCTDAAGLTYTAGAGIGFYQVPDVPEDVTCTFTNTRTSAELTLTKDWVNPVDGDEVGLSAEGDSGLEPAMVGMSIAPDDDTDAVLTVYSGETVTLAESYVGGNTGSYDATLSCTDAAGLTYTAGDLDGTYAVPDAPVDVTCTFVNTRTSAELTLTKAWVDAITGDRVLLSIDGTEGTSPFGTSTAPGTTVPTTLTVYSGEDVTLTESFFTGDPDAYETTLDCDGDDIPVSNLDGTWTVPDEPVDSTCTFTNRALRGNIVIVKNVVGADGTFDFTGNWPDPANDVLPVGAFQLTTAGGTASQTWTGVLAGTHTVSELDPTPEFDNTDLVCVDPDGESSVNGLDGTIDLDDGETVTCTYTNTQRATIVVIKDAVPDDDQSFAFTTSGDPLPDSFDLVDDGTDTANTFTSGLLPANGTYSVDETPVNGWTLTSATCDNGDTPDAIDPDPGETVTCTFTNVADPGSVEVTKSVEGVADTFDWSFEIAIDPVDAGVTSPQTASGTGNTSDTVTFEPLTLNQTYTILEPNLPAGWEQTEFECRNGVRLLPDNPREPGYQVTITEPGLVISCTIVNEAQPSELIVVKQVAGVAADFAWDFEFTLDPATDGEPASQVVSGVGPGIGDNEAVWNNLVPGETYVLSETTQAGFDAGDLTCQGVNDLDQDPQTVTFVAPLDTDPSYEVLCQITNTAIPSNVEVLKTVIGVAEDYDWEFEFSITPTPDGETSPKTTSGTGDGSDFVNWNGLVPGQEYTIAETTQAGFTVSTQFNCTGVTDTDDDPATVTFIAPLGSGALVDFACAIANTAIPSAVSVTKSVEGVADDFDWEFDFTITPVPGDQEATQTADSSGDGSVTWTDLVPGETYTITELLVPGYNAGVLVCDGVDDADGADDESVTFVAPLGTGDVNITCAITNTARPSQVEVGKAVTGVAPEDPAWEFDFTITPVPDNEPATKTASGSGDGVDTVGWDGLVPGETYTISEAVTDGYEAGPLVCVGFDDLDDEPQSVTFVAPLDLRDGPDVLCGIINTGLPGSLTITKDAVGGDGSFDFELDAEGLDPEVYTVDTAGGTGEVTIDTLVPGVIYTLTEVDPGESWIQGDLVCSVAHVDGSVETADLAAGYEVEVEDEISCAITNVAAATIIVDKVTDPAGDPTVFDFQFGPLDGEATDFGLADTDAPAMFDGLAPGDYLVQELVPDGWELTDVTCSPDQFVDEAGAATITVAAGDTVTCTYTNSGRGDLVIDKTVTDLVTNEDNTVAVTYDLVVTGDSAVDEPYTVTDELLFGAGITVTSASVSSDDAATNPAWDGVSDLDVTDGPQTLPAGATHTYTVTATATVTLDSTETSRDCVLDQGETGTGLLNEATVTYDNGTNGDDACEVPPEPEIVPNTITAECVGNIPFKAYSISVPGSDVDSVTITITNPDGDEIVFEDQPLSGLILWPGASVSPPDWPGWILQDDGTWVEGDDGFLWARGEFEVTYTINPSYTETVSYPGPDSDCYGPTNPPPLPPPLPRTGADLGLLGLVAALLLLAGLAAREVSRAGRRRS